MKVLVVLSQPPSPEGGAPGRCAVALLRGLKGHGVDVHAIAARRDFAAAGEPPPDLDVEVLSVSEERSRLEITVDRIRHPRGELAHGLFGAAVRRAARGADVVHLEETETAWCDLKVQKPSLAHIHYLVRKDRPLGPPWRRQFRETIEFAFGERAAIRRHRHLVASSPRIAAELRQRRPGADIVLAPLSLDPDSYSPAPLDAPPTAGLIATASWQPNAAAMRRLVQRVWPKVQACVPEARLRLAGRGVKGLGLPEAGTEVVDEVASGVEFLRGLSLLLFPLDRGSGMKVKVLESIALGVPVVTTAAGAEGIEAGDGVLIGRTDDELATLAAGLLQDPAELQRRGAAARAAFLEHYTPGPATQPLVGLYERMVA